MRSLFLISMLALALALPAFAGTGNWITNGDFENGLVGWESGTLRNGYLAPSIFDIDNFVPLQAYDGTSSGYTADVMAAWSGNSVGWAREGNAAPGVDNWTYVAQTVNCMPGTYTVDQSVSMWKALAGTTNLASRFTAMFLMRVDDQIDRAYDTAMDGQTWTFRSSKWDHHDPVNSWITKQINGGAASSFTTNQGRVQFILAFEDHAGEACNDWYGYAAFDNVVFQTNEEWEVVPEPSSMLALGTGLFGLAGFALRRRR